MADTERTVSESGSNAADAPPRVTHSLDVHGRLAIDLACVNCQYNLRGLEPAGACPECGIPVARTIAAFECRFTQRDWLMNVRDGLRMITSSGVMILLAIGLPLLTMAAAPCGLLLVVLGLLLGCGGIMVVTAVPPESAPIAPRRRRLACAGGVALVAASFMVGLWGLSLRALGPALRTYVILWPPPAVFIVVSALTAAAVMEYVLALARHYRPSTGALLFRAAEVLFIGYGVGELHGLSNIFRYGAMLEGLVCLVPGGLVALVALGLTLRIISREVKAGTYLRSNGPGA